MKNKSRTLIGRAGFTIIELLIAMILVGMVMGIVYSTFISVITSTETANTASEQLYTQTFLTRHLTSHVSQASPGWQPGAVYRPHSSEASPVTHVMADGIFSFVGEDKGNEDSLSFTTSVPMNGVGGLPGYFKQVTYSIVDGSSIEFSEGSPLEGSVPDGPVLLVTEVPIMSYDEVNERQLMADRVSAFKDHAESLEISTPMWTFPIGAMEIKYHDGEDWVDAWDIEEEERLPWAIDITFYWSPWDDARSDEISLESDNQFRMVIAVPGGVGLSTATPEYGRPTVGQ